MSAELLSDEVLMSPSHPAHLLRQYSLNIPRPGTQLLDRKVVSSARIWHKVHEKWRTPPEAASDAATIYHDEVVEVIFGEGLLGIEFAIDDPTDRVVIKSTVANTTSSSSSRHFKSRHITQVVIGDQLRPGLVVDGINDQQLSGVRGDEVLHLLATTPRPMYVSFTTCDSNMVVCRLCECRMEVSQLDEHTELCVFSKKYEQEASQLNTMLVRIADVLESNMRTQDMLSYFSDSDIALYQSMRSIAQQAAACDIASVDSFELCVRLMKLLDQGCDAALERHTSSCVVDRGAKYCARIRHLIHAKMNQMRKTQKKMLVHHAPAPIYRTKSLENQDNNRRHSATPIAQGNVGAKPPTLRVTIEDFDIIKPISKGAYGKVYLAKKKTTGDQYAIKVLAKEHVLRKNQLSNIEAERDILASMQSPFVVKLFWTFQSQYNLFLVMEYLPGGDFMSLLECIVRLEERVACIYIAEIALALNHLHSKGDLKPDNILIASNGHIKLTDFGLSEEGVTLNEAQSPDRRQSSNSDGSSSSGDCHEYSDDEDILEVNDVFSAAPDMDGDGASSGVDIRGEFLSAFAASPKAQSGSKHRCGTPDYLSPEILLGHKHGTPVDYWALGVILYEMLVGFPPFNDDTVEAIFANILDRRIDWPNEDQRLSPHVEDLINRLLDQNPDTRIGWADLIVHPFFTDHGLNWDTLLETTPPFVPTLDDPYDTSYFNNRNLTEAFVDDVGDHGPQTPRALVPTKSIDIPFNKTSSSCGASSGKASSGAPSDFFDGNMLASPAMTPEAFRTFSFTNMHALVAAGREEAQEKITGGGRDQSVRTATSNRNLWL